MKARVRVDSIGRILIPKQIQNLMDIGSDDNLVLDYNEETNTFNNPPLNNLTVV